ncbi:MAG: 3-deoxy-8-phosphooctulonate synthase [Planctomycetes bacterium RBG_16_59_8]|nr:MAG: 3-deoxy-8-phosphooctulonate synthase [Planctomycetes bacterium RBG_16_59_8]
MKYSSFSVGGVSIGPGKSLFLIAGPCVIENRRSLLRTAEGIKDIAGACGIPFIFKSSYDKANRTSHRTFRGPGMAEGLALLAEVRKRLGVPVISDVHSVAEVKSAARVLDILQIPALLCRQTDLVVAAAETGKAVNIKKGQFMAPWDMENIAAKAAARGNRKIILTERGTTFGYNNLVADMRSLAIMRTFGYPVVFDAGHSAQLPGGKGNASGGMREMIPVLARAAVAAGCDGVFVETHENPDKAPSDGPNMLRLADLPKFLRELLAIRAATVRHAR